MKYFLYLLFFALLHFESLTIVGDIKIAQAWKILFIIYALISVKFKIKKNNILSIFWIISFLGFFISFFNDSFFEDIGYNLRVLLIPVFLNFVLLKPKLFKKNALEKISTFVIVSSLFYYFGLISPITSSIVLDNGYEESVGFIGFFQKAHGANSVLSIIAITSWVNLINNQNNRRLNLVIFTLSLIFIFLTFVRTGLFALFGVILFTLLKESKQGKFKKILLFFIIISTSLFYINNNESIKNRFLDKTENNIDKDYSDRVGSSRLLIWSKYIDTYMNYNLANKLIGTGEFKGKNKFSENYGIALIPHNGFIEILAYRGLLGVIVYIFLFFILWKLKFKNKTDELLNKSYVFFFLAIMSTQGLNLVYEFIFISIVISRSNKHLKN